MASRTASGTLPSLRELSGRSSTGARWGIALPANWNGTVCLFSHGYGGGDPDRPVRLGGDSTTEAALLRAGYALVASEFSTQGWAVADALRDQSDVLEIFHERIGTPEITLAWGRSMGGLITAAMAEVAPEAIDAAVPFCASLAGPIPMLNQGLDGAFVLRELAFRDRDLELVRVTQQDEARLASGRQYVDEAMSTATGRARMAFAAAVAQMPVWSAPNLRGAVADPVEPHPNDWLGQLQNQASVFALAAFSPRIDLEKRADGVFSWNTGIDYRSQLQMSGTSGLVDRAYAAAGLDLEADLARLESAERIVADVRAVEYMEANFTPTGEIGVPVLTVSLTGDYAPTVTQAAAYASSVDDAGNSALLRQVFVHAPGHCAAFRANEIVAGIRAAELRVQQGEWAECSAASMNERAREAVDDGNATDTPPRFVDYTPRAHVRPHSVRRSALGRGSALDGRKMN